MILIGKSLIIGILALFLAISPSSTWAITADELLKQLEEERVLTPEKAEKIKQRGKEADKQAAKDSWKAKWDNGLKVYRADGQFDVSVGGRIHLDFANISSSDSRYVDTLRANEGNNVFTGTGAEFRRARLKVEGSIYKYVEFKAEYDFASGDGAADFKDVYMGIKDIPYIGTVRVGHQKEPFSLEELTSSNYITFMERALPVSSDVFSPERNTGILAFNTAYNKRLWWGVGTFVDSDNFGNNYNNFQDWNVTARLAGTPYYVDKGRRLFFIGMAYTHQFRNDRVFQRRYRARPEAHITDVRMVNTGNFFVGNTDIFNPQMALVWGPFSVQGEYFLCVNGASTGANPALEPEFRGNPNFQGGYAYVSYFLTGEHRAYSQSSGCFTRVKPNNNFYPANGTWGAFEVAARWSYLDLSDKGIGGGIQNDATFGLNWYLNPNTRWMFNYVYVAAAKRQNNVAQAAIRPTAHFGGDANIVQTRFQIDF